MASIQAHLLDAIVRAQIKRRLMGITDINAARTILQGGSLPISKRLVFTTETIGGVAGEWVHDAEKTPVATLLYLHGGGYFACSPITHRAISGAYAKQGFAVFVPRYRLAPEHPFPAALDDAEAAWNGLVAEGYLPHTLTVSGDSAGGGLALALMLTLRTKAQPLPAATALFSPWTDLAATGASVRTNVRREAMFWAPGLVNAGKIYLGDISPDNPLASPHYADLTGLPPMLIHVGDREILRDDSVRLAEHADAAGVSVELKVWPVVPHVWQLANFVPEARMSIIEASDFLSRHTNTNG